MEKIPIDVLYEKGIYIVRGTFPHTSKTIKIKILEISKYTIFFQDLDSETKYCERIFKDDFDGKWKVIEFLGFRNECPLQKRITELYIGGNIF